jgi:D-aspartate ligase
VIGDLDLAWPLRDAGIAVTLIAPEDDPARRTRTCRVGPARPDPGREPDELIRVIVDEARRTAAAPVLYVEDDGALLVASRRRGELESSIHQVLAPADVVEALVDKARFAALAERTGLPTPSTAVLRADDDIPDAHIRYPAVAKPITRPGTNWAVAGGGAKAVLVRDAGDLERQDARAAGHTLIVQEYLQGPESFIESHHAYVCRDGRLAGEFTGRKVRTSPRRFGYSSALMTTSADDVAALGRQVIAATGLVGFVKTDMKRDASGCLRILEVNPRPTLWLALGRAAGADLLAAAHADACGLPVPAVARARPGARWWNAMLDLRACVDGGELRSWLAFGMGADVRSGMALGDPGPFVGAITSAARSRLVRA